MFLLATDPTTSCGGWLPHDFLPGLLGTAIYFTLGLIFLALCHKVIDWITPGDLKSQLLGLPDPELGGLSTKTPNIALAIVVAGLTIAMGLIVAASIK